VPSAGTHLVETQASAVLAAAFGCMHAPVLQNMRTVLLCVGVLQGD
jgi:hypothetical protein